MNSQLLKGTRVIKGYTQTTLSKAMGITPKTYNRKELGITDFSHEEVIKMTQILGLTLDEVNNIFFDNKLTNRKDIA
jgi:DNA-binding XRE family transcriptional regulator